MVEFVVDASAILAFVFDEPGGDALADAAREGAGLHVSAVNISEVYAKLTDKGFLADEIETFLVPLALNVVPLDEALARSSGLLRQRVDRSLSLGDRCCLALGVALGMPVMTADRLWTKHARDLGVRIVVTRPNTTP